MDQKKQVRASQFKLFKQFLETASLYQKAENPLGKIHSDQVYDFLPLMSYCPNCRDKTTFTHVEEKSEFKHLPKSSLYGGPVTSGLPFENKTVRLEYLCQHCTSQTYSYLITENGGKIFKSGQNPPISIQISDLIEKKLGLNLSDHYKKGKICESQGYGIATMAYYRRIVEEKIKDILTESMQYINDSKKEDYTKQIEAVIAAHNFDKKAEVLYDLTPEILKPDGHNLIKALFSKISEGLHSKDDENCLAIAKDVAELLEIIVETLNSEAEKIKRIKILQKRI